MLEMNSAEIAVEIRRLKEFCNVLEKPKLTITEKQQILSRLTEALKNVEICNFIDESSRCANNESADTDDDDDCYEDENQFAWQNLYRVIYRVFSQELAKFKTSVDSKSKRTFKLDSLNCFKLILARGLKIENALNVDAIGKFLLNNLNDDVVCNSYFKDFTSILVDCLLKNEEAAIVLTEELFKGFCSIYIDLLQNPQDNNLDLCSSTLLKLLNVGIWQFDLDFRNLLNQFCSIFNRTINNANTTFWSNLIACFNILIKFYGFDDRETCCRLGELISNKILSEFQCTSDSSIEFFLQQMILHHPRSATFDSNGAIINDDWKDVVKALYLRLYEIFDKESNLITNASSCYSEHLRFKQNERLLALINLMSRTILKVFEWGDDISCFGTTQLNSTFLSSRRRISDMKLTSTQNKRVCIEVGWAAFVRNIDDRLFSLTASNWLLILKTVLLNFFDCIESDDLKLITNSLLKWFSICKKPEILKSCCSVAKILIDKLNDGSKITGCFNELLLKFYDVLIRLTFVKNVQNEIFDVLASLVACDIVGTKRLQRDLCLLLASAVHSPSKTACEYLFEFFRHCEFVERISDKSILASSFEVNEKFEFRLFLIDWLTGRRNNFEDNAFCNVFASVPPRNLAANLHQICLKRPFKYSNFRNGIICEEFNAEPAADERRLADLYSLIIPPGIVEVKTSLSCIGKSDVIVELVKEVSTITAAIFDDIIKDIIKLTDIKILNSLWSFGYYVYVWMKSLDMDENTNHNLENLFSVLIEQFATSVNNYKIDFIDKFSAIIQLMERNGFCLPVNSSLLEFLEGTACSFISKYKSQSSVCDSEDVKEETKQEAAAKNELKLKTISMLVQLSCYRIECPMKFASEEKTLNVLQTIFNDDDEDIFVISKQFAVTLISVVSEIALNASCSVSFARELLSLIKKVLDHCYKNFKFCNEVLLSCAVLPQLSCFRDADVQEKFLKILTGFKKLSGSLKLTCKLKSILIRCFVNVEKSAPNSKISLVENNNGITIPITKVLMEFLSDGCYGFYEICTNITKIVQTRAAVENYINALYNNAVQDNNSCTKFFCLIRALIVIMRNFPDCHAICTFVLCRIYSLSADCAANVTKALKLHFSADEIYDILSTNLTFCVLQWEAVVGDWKLFPFSLLDLDDIINGNETLIELIENWSKRQFHSLVNECWSQIYVDYLLNRNDLSSAVLDSFEQMSKLDLKKFFPQNFSDILRLLMNRLGFEKTSTFGEINEKAWSYYIQQTMKRMACRSLTDYFSNMSEINIVEFFLNIRASIASTKFYSEVRFRRFVCLFNYLNFANFGALSTFIVREIVLTMTYLLQLTSDSDHKILKSILLLCQKLYKEVPKIFVNNSLQLLSPLVRLTSKCNRYEATELIKFLFSVWSQSSSQKVSSTSFLPPVDWLSEFRNFQFRIRDETNSIDEDINRILSSPIAFVQKEDLDCLFTKLESNGCHFVFSDNFKTAQLMNNCRLLCETRTLTTSVSKIVDFCYRHYFTSAAILPELVCSYQPVIKHIVEALDIHLQRDDSIVSSTAWKCLKHFLINTNSSFQLSDFQNEHAYLASISIGLKDDKSYNRWGKSTAGRIQFDSSFYDLITGSVYETWIVQFLVDFICQLSYTEINFASLKDICEKSVSFCESLFPVVLEYILIDSTQLNREMVAQNCNKLLACLLKNASNCNRIELRKYVNLFLSLLRRLQNSSGKGYTLSRYKLLPIDYCLLAEVCLHCGFYHESVLFVEIGAESFRTDELYKIVHVDRSKKNVLACLNERFSNVLQESYIRLTNTDAVYGLGESVLSNPVVRSYLWVANHEWNKVISFYSSLNNADVDLYKQAAFALGMNDYDCVSNFDNNEEILQAYRCQCAWRLGDWDLVEASKKKSSNFNQFVYDAITSDIMDLKQFDIEHGSFLINSQISHKSWNNVRDFLEKMCLLNETQNYVENFPTSPSILLQKWNSEALSSVKPEEKTGQFFENYQSFRWAVLNKHLPIFADKDDIFVQAVTCFVNITKSRIDWCMSQNMPSVALKLAKQCKSSVVSFERNIPVALLFAADFCEIETLWKSDEQFLAISKLKSLRGTLQKITNRNSVDVSLMLAKCLILLGEYKTKLDSPESAENCFSKAVTMLKSFSTKNADATQILCSAYASLARYADENYQNLTDYIKSSNFVSKKNLIEQFKQQCVSAAVKQGKTYITIDKKSNVDQREVDEIVEAQQNLMQMALSYYLHCLALSNEYDLKIFRVISLWFDNLDSNLLASSFVQLAQNVPSHKWLLVWTQLTSRLSLVENKSDPFVRTLYEIIRKTALHHPYHTFYTLYCLAHSSSNNELEDNVKKSRTDAAVKLIKELKTSRGDVFNDLEELANCYMEVGKIDTLALDRRGEHSLPARIVNYVRNVPAITKTLAVQPSGRYENFVVVQKFENKFSIASGKSAPVIVRCRYSDGTSKKQLVKGHDDTRQDAIMEQVFSIVNLLLQNSSSNDACASTSRMRIYNIIPLSPFCGVIEWCHGAVSFGDYLVGSDYRSGAHKRFRPNDLVGTDCRAAIQKVSTNSLEKKIKIYTEVCSKLQPVFRHFFFERFLEPIVWYDACINYTRSAAISSIVGHVLGLSDRHTQNILIDETTAEIIQIDLGMAFEQGKILPTPEKVPFRLTRDIVDGMGVCGVEGVFRRNCERVMRLLRDSVDILLPIVSVLLHDPVSEWVLTDSKIKEIQPSRREEKKLSSQSRNEHAERAILKVMEKLKGMEGKAILTVEGQVAYLINEARNPANLAQMFCGWQAYL